MKTQPLLLLACALLGCSSPPLPVSDPATPPGRAQSTSSLAPAPSAPTAAAAPLAAAPTSAPTVPLADLAALVSESKASCKPASPYAISVSIPQRSSSLRCKEGFRKCEGEIPVTIENCTGEEVIVHELHLQGSGVVGEIAHARVSSKPWAPIPPGMRVTRNVEVNHGAKYEAMLMARGKTRGYGLTSEVGELLNPAYVAAVASCTACNGDWGRHGIHQMEGCVCRANDRGKTCYDGDECEGVCVHSHIEKLGRGMGRDVGKCSEFIGGFGCVAYIERGASKKNPRSLSAPWSQAQSCAD
jgi:hypothetical protein